MGMNWYKRDPDRALAGMAELTLQERGAYNTIIDSLYARDGILRDDDELLRRIMGCHGNEWRHVKARLLDLGKIWIEDGHIKAKRVDATLQEAGNFSETQRKRSTNRDEIADKQAGKVVEISKNTNEINATAKPITTTPRITTRKKEDTPSLFADDSVDQAFNLWNEMAKETGLPAVKAISDSRRRQCRARLRDGGGLAGWAEALAKIRANPFLLGDNDRGWRADIDFLLRQSRFVKLLEGGYDRPGQAQGKPGAGIDLTGKSDHWWVQFVGDWIFQGYWPEDKIGPAPNREGTAMPAHIPDLLPADERARFDQLWPRMH